MRRKFAHLALGALAFGMLGKVGPDGLPGSAIAAESPDRPNIIVVFTDDHGWPDIGAAGVYDDLATPHIDRLAADGVRCTAGYVTAPQCVPSRGGLLAGRDQSRFGLETNASSLEGFDRERTIAERLGDVGYATGQIGKWHLGPVREIPEHGFEDVFAKNSARPAFATYRLDGSDREPGSDDTPLYHLDACSRAAEAFIDRHAGEPFFLYLAYRAPHVPLDAPEKYLSRFPGEMPERRRQALAMLSAMDDGIGAIRAKLEEHGLSEETLIFFIGDNGAPLKIHKIDAPGGGPGWDGSLNAPMNGEKGMLSEGGIRVPFVAAWPGTILAGQVFDLPVISLDIAATAAALTDLKEVDGLDGVNLIPAWTGNTPDAAKRLESRTLFWRWSSQAAIRSGDWKYLRGGTREYLYDLGNDPGESRNLADDHPDVLAGLREQLHAWSKELRPPGWIGDGMPETWERYFDHYLDGKTVPEPDASGDGKVRGWIARNARFETRAEGLRVIPEGRGGRFRPFLARSGLSIAGPVDVRVEFRDPPSGEVSVEWREAGQRDFESGQRVVLTADAAHAGGRVDTDGEVIHLRLRLPDSGAVIRSIRLRDGSGRPAAAWRFVGKGSR